MKDKWINVGYDSDELKPHTEPVEDLNDTNRIGEKPLTLHLLPLFTKWLIAIL